MFKKFIPLTALFFGHFFSVNAQETLLLRSPSISNTHVSFVYGGDVWVADKSGQNPRRLTVNPGVELNPMFSPDGQRIAFTGNYDGNTDVYTVSIQGGEPQRITHHPASDVLRGWIDNKEVYFSTSREMTYSLGARLYKRNLNSGTDQPLLMPEAYQGSPSPDGRYWAYIKNSDPTERDRVAFKRYRGGGMPSIWIFDTKSHDVEIVPGENCNDVKPLWLGSKVYFLSDREKIVNIFSYDTKTKKVEKLTNYTDYDVRSLNGNGNELVFEQAGKIHILNTGTKNISSLAISIQADALYKRPRYVEMREGIRSWNISPTGQRALFESRGEIFSVPKEKGDARNISNSPGTHERFPSWSPNGKWISYFSYKDGKYQLVLRDQKASDNPIFINLGDNNFYFYPRWSPDSKKVLYNDAHLNLYYVDVDTKEVVHVANDHDGSQIGRSGNPFSASWSPDSKWITYTKSLKNGIASVFMYNVTNKQAQQITDGMSVTYQPVFTRDGKYLVFLASTNTGLTNSGLHMTAYDRRPDYNVYAFILSSETPSIFKNESDEETVKEDKPQEKAPKKDEEKKDDKKDEKGDEKESKTPKTNDIKVDFNNINSRIVALDIPTGSFNIEGNVENMLLYVRGRSLYSYDLNKLEEKNLIDNINGFIVSADGKKMIYGNQQGYSIVNAGQKPSGDGGRLKIENIKQQVDPSAEWNQVFDEVWTMQKEFFYVENMHGVDWEAMRTKYQKFLPFVNHRSDLGYLLNELMGEMVVGHNYIYPGDQPSTPSVSSGVLGADYEIVNGRYRIKKIYTRMDWNPSFKAPLAEPGLKIKEGDYILTVNGQDLTAEIDIFSLFDNTVNKQITLKVNSKPSLDGATDIIVKPISYGDEVSLRQQDWVESNRRKVNELSNGQIAYVYMPNTGREGYTSFNRYYFSQMDKKALLLDERNNGGGSVADYVIDLLSRELISGWGIRDGKSFTTPGNGIYGPKAMIINENAGSGGDMMPYMFRFRGLGKLVGRTTMGILVGISGYPPLLDGGSVTSPNFGVFDLEGNYIIENEGVAPDVFVEQMPKELLKGRDPQLERTVQILLDEMKTYPYKELKKPADPIRVN